MGEKFSFIDVKARNFFKRQLLVEGFMEIRERDRREMNFVKSESFSSKIDLIKSSLGFLRVPSGSLGFLRVP